MQVRWHNGLGIAPCVCADCRINTAIRACSYLHLFNKVYMLELVPFCLVRSIISPSRVVDVLEEA